ncbi:MAG: hypothetical protein HY366_02975 [Candidatus Aenigmarchaeota archaeon]|nr:hypothetical protein [Candidatus Aenigmarchaeota archaeon]
MGGSRAGLPIFVILMAIALSFTVGAILVATPEAQFNVNQSTIYLNWTAVDTSSAYEANITISGNQTMVGFRAAIQNQSHTIFPNYSQPIGSSDWTLPAASSGYAAANCGSGTTTRVPLRIKNATSITTNETLNITGTSSFSNENLTLFFPTGRACPPGRYFGILNVTNATNVTQYANITVILDVPIDPSNTISTNGANAGQGQFRGILDVNETEDHRYYFNTSSIINATSVLVNLSWSGSSDVDLFLLDHNGVPLKRSVSHGSTTESLVFLTPAVQKMYNIRLYGNSSAQTDYTSAGGFLVIGTLNATNATASGEPLNSTDFRTVSPTSISTVNVALANVGLVNQTNVVETKELSLIQRFSSATAPGTKNFTLRVPDFVTKIDVRLNWNGSTNYTLTLVRPDGSLFGLSNNKSLIANRTGFGPEEVVIFSPSVNVGHALAGVWTIGVINNTAGPDNYNVTARLYVDASPWLSSNYTTRSFNQTGMINTSGNHQFNFTVANATLSGEVEGRLRYTSAAGAVLDVPFTADISTGELMANATFNSSSVNVTDNIGFNRTNSTAINFTIWLNNTGNDAITFGNLVNSSNLTLSSDATKHILFNTTGMPSSIAASSSANVNVTLLIDTTKTSNSQGVYTGWLLFNTTNGRPYSTFNMTMRVNLTGGLNVFQRGVTNSSNNNAIANVTNDTNITVLAQVFYTNNTEVTDLTNVTGNFTVYLLEPNTSTRVPSTGTLTINNRTLTQVPDLLYLNSKYQINATVPGSSTRPGGYYQVYVGASDTRLGGTSTGNGTNASLQVNNVGLFLAAVSSTTISVADSGVASFNMTVRNLGTLKPAGFLNMSNTTIATVTSNDSSSNCAVTTSSNGFQFTRTDDTKTISPEDTETCWFRFKIAPANVTSTQTATLTVSATGGDASYNSLSVGLTVTNADGTTSSSSPAAGAGAGAAAGAGAGAGATEAAKIFDISSFPANVEIVQGNSKSASVVVKNLDNKTQTAVALGVTGATASWIGVTPATATILAFDNTTYTVTYTIPEDAEIKVYDLTYKASNANGDKSVTGKLTVQPTNKTKALIDTKYADALQNLTALKSTLDALAKKNYDVAPANTTYAELNEKLAKAGEAIAKGDYITANALLVEADALLADLATKLDAAVPLKKGGGALTVVLGVVGLVVVGLVAYMFLPPRKEAYTVGAFKYNPPGGGAPLERAKHRLKALVQRLKEAVRRTPKPSTPKFDFTRRGPSWS